MGTPPVWAGHPPGAVPSARWNAHKVPVRSPITIEGEPSRLATDGDDSAVGEPPSGKVWVHTSDVVTAWD
jgi:hypothetical protein